MSYRQNEIAAKLGLCLVLVRRVEVATQTSESDELEQWKGAALSVSIYRHHLVLVNSSVRAVRMSSQLSIRFVL